MAAKGANLNGQAADDFRSKFAKLFSEFFLNGTERQTEDELVGRWRCEYETNRIKFEQQMKEVCGSYVRLTDLNSDGNISKDEYKAQLMAPGFESFDDKYFDAFPKTKNGEISNDILLEALVKYYCNSDENNVGRLERIICYGMKVVAHNN